MPPVVKKIIARTILVFSSVFLLSVILTAFFEDKIGRLIIAELNKNITTELKVEDVSLSLIRAFPKVSATLKNVRLADTGKKNLLSIGELSFSMGIWSAFTGKPSISKIKLKDGVINIVIDNKGKPNYEIFKKNTDNKSQNDVSFSISKAIFDNFAITYTNQLKQSDYKATITKGTLAGEFSADQFILDLDTDWILNSIMHENSNYLQEKPLSLTGKFDINSKKGTYKIKECLLNLASNNFTVEGSVNEGKNGTDFDLFALGKDINLESVFNLGISQLNDAAVRFKSKGIIQVNARIDGTLNASSNPAILVQYNLKNGSVQGKDVGGMIDQISFTGSFSNGWSHNFRTSSFSLDNCKASFNGLPFSLNLKLRNFEKPDIDLSANGKIPLERVYAFIAQAKGGTGFINVKNVVIKGNMADMRSDQGATRVKASGSILFEDAVLNYRGEDLKFSTGEINFSNNFINLTKVDLRGLDSDLQIDGRISDYLPFIFSKDPNDKLGLGINIHSNYINLERWMTMLSDKDEVQTKTTSSTPVNSGNPFDKIQGTIKADLDVIKHKKIMARNFSGDLIFEGGDMLVSGDVQAMEGDWNIEGQLNFDNTGSHLKATLESSKVNIKEFFAQSDNFGQETLTDNNLSGRLNSRILILADWDKNGKFDINKLHVYGSMSVDNGEMRAFKLLESFSAFIKMKDLRNIRFVNLKNLIEIEDGIIHIPAMFIQSNAANLTVSGQHTFNNDIEYNFKINAGQVLLNKLNLVNKTSDALPAQKGGFFNLYYNLKGTTEKFVNKRDKSLVKSNFTKSEIRKHKIMNTLLAEFGSMPEFDEPDGWSDQGENPKSASFTNNNSFNTGNNTALRPSLKSTLEEAKQTLKNPTKAVVKPEKKTFRDEEDEEVEYLDFK